MLHLNRYQFHLSKHAHRSIAKAVTESKLEQRRGNGEQTIPLHLKIPHENSVALPAQAYPFKTFRDLATDSF